MKFSLKILIGTMVIVALMFTISGIFLIHSNFKNSYNLQMNHNIEEHYLEKYSIETNINDNIDKNGNIDIEDLESYLHTLTSYLENSRKLLIYVDDELVWDNVPFDLNQEMLKDNIITHEADSKKYSIITSNTMINNQNVLVVSAFDISGVFQVRDQNLHVFYIIDIILLILCGCVTTLFARVLTKPLHKLEETTRMVADGNLDVAIEGNTNDEIGSLAKSFNIMVDSIKSKITELELSVRKRDDFVSNFTHELKTPMTSIMGYAKVLKSNKYKEEDKAKALDYIYSESKRLEVLSHKMLDLLELSSGHIELKEIDTKTFFDSLKDLAILRLSNINLVIDIEDKKILGDEELLNACFINLLENAKKASDKNSEIKIVGKVVKNKYQVSIMDKGEGIEEKELDRITESFYMIDRSRSKSKGGYGIGLAICEKIAELHHTNLRFKSKVGKGTTVSLELEVVNEK